MSKTCCGRATKFDPGVIGRTVGGLWLKGWDRCGKCCRYSLSRRGAPCDAPTWRLASGGRSVDIGNGRIRFGGLTVESEEKLDVVGLMERIARLPELEREVERLRALVTEEQRGGAKP